MDRAMTKVLSQRRSNASQHAGQIARDFFRSNAQHAVAFALENPVATRVRTLPKRMIPAANFDDEARCWRNEVQDVVPNDDLTAEADSEATSFQLGPKALFGDGHRGAQRI